MTGSMAARADILTGATVGYSASPMAAERTPSPISIVPGDTIDLTGIQILHVRGFQIESTSMAVNTVIDFGGGNT